MVWDAGDEIEAIAPDLDGKGVAFERDDISGAAFRAGDTRMAWRKDPDVNILHAVQMAGAGA